MRPVSDLALAHVGRPALVIGGGESAPRQVQAAPAGALTISVNQHGCLLMEKCDYLVACDNKPGRRYVSARGMLDLRSFGIPVISSRPQMADFRIFKVPVNNSGVVAAWVAWLMGCAPILLAGMDLYLGNATYFHSPKAQSTGRHLPASSHLGKWEQLKGKIPDAMFRPISGPLVGVFPRYDPAEVPPVPPSRETILAQARGTLARHRSTGRTVEVDAVELFAGLQNGELARV